MALQQASRALLCRLGSLAPTAVAGNKHCSLQQAFLLHTQKRSYIPPTTSAAEGAAPAYPGSVADESRQGPTDAARGGDPLTRKIVTEHRKLEHMFQEYENPKTTAEEKLRLGWEIIRGLSVHAAKEEMVMYPAVATHFGDAAADHLVEEHQTLKNTLYEMDAINDPNNPRFHELVRKTVEVTRHHVRQEEEDYLPKLANKVGPGGMATLADQFDAARLAAPTRPHPAAPNRPPLNIPANASAVPLDLARDAIRFGPGNVTGDVEDHTVERRA